MDSVWSNNINVKIFLGQYHVIYGYYLLKPTMWFFSLPFDLLHLVRSISHPYLWQLSICSLYLFIVCFVLFIFHIWEVIWYLSFSVWFISLSIKPSRSTYIVANDKILFFLWLNNIHIYIVYTYICVYIWSFTIYLSIHP